MHKGLAVLLVAAVAAVTVSAAAHAMNHPFFVYQKLRLFVSLGPYYDTVRMTFVEVPLRGLNYNAGLVVVHGGDRRCSYTVASDEDQVRVVFRNEISWGNSNVYAMTLGGGTSEFSPEFICGRSEDPRFVVIRGRPYVSVSRATSFCPKVIKQHLLSLSDRKLYVPALNNVKSRSNWEKNWLFFEHDGGVYVIYSIQPFVVYRLDESTFEALSRVQHQEWKSSTRLRGGTPPVWVHDRYYIAAHSTDYRTYMLTFSGDLELLEHSERPICERDSCRYGIYFVSGLLYDARNDSFVLGLGVNDQRVALLTVPKAEVDANLTRVVVSS